MRKRKAERGCDGIGETDRDRQTWVNSASEKRRDRRQSEKDVGGRQELEAKAEKKNMTVNQRERQKKRKNLLLFLAENKKNSTAIPHTENTKILNISVLLQ